MTKFGAMTMTLIALHALLAGCYLFQTVPATRADLAAAYLELEESLRDAPPRAATVERINRAFDEASLSFFTFRYADAMKAIRGITYEVKPSAISRTAANLLWSLKAELSPPVGVADKT
ncbi:MAG: hypothetical protein ACKVS9_11030, partial [Phycisphaerae bacterium]